MAKKMMVWGTSLPVMATIIESSAVRSHSRAVERLISDPMLKTVTNRIISCSRPGRNELLR